MAIQSARGAPTTRGTSQRAGGFMAVSKRLLGKDWPVAFVFAAPLVLLLFGLIGIPLVRAAILSLYSSVGLVNRGFVGFDNYTRLWGDSQFRERHGWRLSSPGPSPWASRRRIRKQSATPSSSRMSEMLARRSAIA